MQRARYGALQACELLWLYCYTQRVAARFRKLIIIGKAEYIAVNERLRRYFYATKSREIVKCPDNRSYQMNRTGN